MTSDAQTKASGKPSLMWYVFNRIYYSGMAYLFRGLFKATLIWNLGSINFPSKPDSILFIQSRDPGRKIKTTTFKPAHPKPGPQPVLINFHGSGFILPLRNSDDEFCRKMAKEGNHFVIDVQYRLAPEYRFPAPLDDAEDVIKWVLSQPERFDKSRISLSGFSAGTNISASVAVNQFPKGTIKSLISIYGAVDMSDDLAAKKAPVDAGRQFPVRILNMFINNYIDQDQSIRQDPRASPALAPLDRYPDNCLFFTGSWDSLAPEIEDLARRLQTVKGSSVVVRRFEGCHHGWDKRPESKVQQEAKDEAYRMSAELLASL